MPATNIQRRRASQSTKYSVNFNALPDNASDASSLLGMDHKVSLDVIRTDDIDGPTDFTQNMELWMRGELPLKSHGEDILNEHSDKVTDGKYAEIISEKLEGDTTNHRSEEDDALPSRSRTSSLSSLEQQEKVLSYLETLADAEIPDIRVESPKTFHTVKSARSLQPTVEDSDTPRKSSAGTAFRHSSQPPETPHKDVSSRVTELEEELRRQTEEAECALAKLKLQLSSTRAELDQALAKMQLQQRQVESLEEDHAARIQVLSEEWAQKLADVNVRNDNAMTEALTNHLSAKEELESRVNRLQSQVDHEVQTRQASHEATLLAHEQEIVRWESRLDSKVASHKEELYSLQQQLDELKTERDSNHEALRTAHRLELEKQRATYEEHLAHLPEAANQPAPPTNDAPSATPSASDDTTTSTAAQLATVRAELASARMDILRKDADIMSLSQAKGRSDALLATSRSTTTDLRTAISRLESELDRAREQLDRERLLPPPPAANADSDALAEARAAAAKLAAGLDAARSKHEAEMADARARAEAAVRKIGALLDAEKVARATAAVEAERARDEAAALREDHASVNAAMDERVVALVRGREAVWRGRVARLERERAQVGKALMREWGRREIGKGVGEGEGEQAYRYKFAVGVETGS